MSKSNKRRFKRLTLKSATIKEKKPIRITVLDYDENNFQFKEVSSVDECQVFKDKPTVTWINVDGIHEPEILEKLANYFGLHPLIQEDIADVDQRAKIEDLDDYLYIGLKMLSPGTGDSEIDVEQFSLVLGKNFVLSFQETVGDIFNPIREHLKNPKNRIRKMGADYLVYTLIDSIVDNYFKILDGFGEKIEFLEEEIIAKPDQLVLKEIYHLKREMIFLRNLILPLRESLRVVDRSESTLLSAPIKIYFRDIYDHASRVVEYIDIYREMLSSMIEAYLSSLSNKMNEVMKVLTMIATIFMPLTFITGLFGMNFKYMPGLERIWGFPIAIAVMLGTGIYMFQYFKKQGWM